MRLSMRKDYAASDGMAVGLLGWLGLLATLAGCSGSVQNTTGSGCSYRGQPYTANQTFPAGDGCNTCQCSEQGEALCTQLACEPYPTTSCTSAGKQYTAGQQVSSDGCNTCTCTNSGEVECLAGDCADAGPTSCASLTAQMNTELSSAQSCKSAADCGQPITGSSCGCTRDLVARTDADLTSYKALKAQVDERGCATEGGSTCDCPSADGFACIDAMCTWNYVTD